MLRSVAGIVFIVVKKWLNTLNLACLILIQIDICSLLFGD